MTQSKMLLAVSVGTAEPEALAHDLLPAEQALAAAFPDRGFHRAFVSPAVLRRLADGGTPEERPDEALQTLLQAGARDILVQPLMLTPGDAWTKLTAALRAVAGDVTLRLGAPLLDKPADLLKTAAALAQTLPPMEGDKVILYAAHGLPDGESGLCAELDAAFRALHRFDVRVGVLNGRPGPDALLQGISSNVRRVQLRPLMLTAGRHARHDLAGDWAAQFRAAGLETDCVLEGLGANPGVRELFCRHAKNAAPYPAPLDP